MKSINPKNWSGDLAYHSPLCLLLSTTQNGFIFFLTHISVFCHHPFSTKCVSVILIFFSEFCVNGSSSSLRWQLLCFADFLTLYFIKLVNAPWPTSGRKTFADRRNTWLSISSSLHDVICIFFSLLPSFQCLGKSTPEGKHERRVTEAALLLLLSRYF